MVEPISDRRLAIWRNAAGLPARHVDIPRDVFEALLARLDAAETERDAARDALSAWFDTEKRTMEELRPQLRAASDMYLRRCSIGGMPGEQEKLLRQHVDAIMDLYAGSVITPFIQHGIEALAVAEAERDRLRAEAAWRPIETAPRDGAHFLAIINDEVRLVRWGKVSHIPLYGFCLADSGPENSLLCAPTHWRPLPPPPGAAP